MKLDLTRKEKSQLVFLLITLIAAIFTVEFSIMLFLYFFGITTSNLTIGFIDSLLLVLIVFPVIYLVTYRPLLLQIKERRQAEENLMKEKNFLDSTIDSLPGIFYLFDGQGRFLRWNKNFEQVSGYSAKELSKMHPQEFFAGEDKRIIEQRIQEVFTEGQSTAEADLVSKGGRKIPYFFTGRRVTLDHTQCLVGMGIDVTERRRAEEVLKNYTVRLEETNRFKDLFTDIMHHDLLNPLGVIKLATDMPPSEKMDKEVRNTFLMIRRNTDKLIDMTRTAGAYAKLESAEKLERSKLDLNEMLRATADNFKLQIQEKNMKLEFLAKDKCYAEVNPIFETVFSNLLDNAIKYSPDGKKIEIDIIEENDYCKVYFKDWGYGIKEEDKPRLFTRFERVDKKGVKGTGLGLAIVKRIVELHGGRVWIEDNPEGGSIFYVDVPKIS